LCNDNGNGNGKGNGTGTETENEAWSRVALKKQYLRSKLKVRWDVTATHGLRVGKKDQKKRETTQVVANNSWKQLKRRLEMAPDIRK